MASVRSYMSTELITFRPNMDIHLAINILLEHQISGGPVVDARGKVVGMLSEKDCLKIAFSASYYQQFGGQVSEYMVHDVQTIDADTDIVTAAEKFVHNPYSRFPVIADGQVVGQISRSDVLRALQQLW